MKKRYRFRLAACILAAVLSGGCGRAGQEEKRKEPPLAETESVLQTEGEELPSGIVFEGKDMEGNVVSESVFSESRLTMVNVWATYCNPCLNEMPGLGELAGEYDAKDFQIIGIISDVLEGADEKTVSNAAGLIAKTGADYPHLLLNESLYYALLSDVSAVPTTFFLDENGVILDTVIGAMDKNAWEEKINALLEK